jgi:flagellar basal-body rod protein FlgC
MSLYSIFQISSQGMTAQRERLEVAAANLANSNTTRTSDSKLYRRRDVVFSAVELDAESNNEQRSLNGVKSETILAPDDQFILRYQPGHPDADANGYVKMPDVDPLEETVNMLSAARSFEANATAFNTAKDLAKTSLSLGDVG